jgi:carbon-monoxide dehydrogenase large subunit
LDELRDRTQGRAKKFGLGQAVRRKEDIRFVTGRGRYLDDVQLENEVYAAFVRSPHAHALLTSIDAEASYRAPGVIGGIMVGSDIVAGTLPVRGGFKSRDGSDLKSSPKALLPTDKVQFAGEAVAMVVAETTALAKDAAELVVVDYEPLGSSATVEDAANAPMIWDGAPGNLAYDWADGAAFARAARTVSVELVQNRVVPNPMEPRGAIGLYDSARGSYTLYTSTQGPSSIRDRIAGALLKIPPQKLRVITPDRLREFSRHSR